jgi:hypothetical protein
MNKTYFFSESSIYFYPSFMVHCPEMSEMGVYSETLPESTVTVSIPILPVPQSTVPVSGLSNPHEDGK